MKRNLALLATAAALALSGLSAHAGCVDPRAHEAGGSQRTAGERWLSGRGRGARDQQSIGVDCDGDARPDGTAYRFDPRDVEHRVGMADLQLEAAEAVMLEGVRLVVEAVLLRSGGDETLRR